MADPLLRFEDNCEGKFYVDQDCIACDTCVGISPKHFALTPNYSHAIVCKQPQSDVEIQECLDALEACPVFAIGVLS